MPVYHLINHDAEGTRQEGPSNVPEDGQVCLQHMENYNYAELLSREKVLEGLKERRDEELRALATLEVMK